MSEFATQPLEQVADLLSGGTPRKTDLSLWDGAIPWLTPKDMGRFYGKTEKTVAPEAIGNGTRLAPNGSIFIAVRGMSLHSEIRIIRTDQQFTFNQDIKAIVPRQGTDGRFLFYALLAKKPDLLDSVEAAGHGTGRLPTDLLRSVPIPDILSSQQEALGSLFGVLDDKIDLNRRMNETLEAMARAIFKDWFVDFGPVRAKAAGRPPPGLAPDIAALFPDALDDDDKPVGWDYAPVAQVVEFNPRDRLKKGCTAPYLDMAALPTDCSWPNTPRERPFSSGTKFRNGDTLLARITPCLENGKTSFVQCLSHGQIGWGSTEFIVIRPKDPVPSEYGYMLARDADFREFAIQSMTGTSGRQRVQTNALLRFQVAVPSPRVFETFGYIVRPWFELVKANSLQSNTLTQLRDLLLPKLMSGEIRLREAEEALEVVA